MAKRHANRRGDLESMFLRLEELVLANSGEDEFEEIFKLTVAKLWDEASGKPQRFRFLEKAEDTYREVSGLLAEAREKWPGILEPTARCRLTPEHLQVCVEALADHRILGEGLEVWDAFFEFLVARSAKGSKGQYFTPRHVVDFCVRMLKPTSRDQILDPACGSGGFLIHALSFVRENENLTNDEAHDYAKTKLWGFEIDSRAARVAKALMILAGAEPSNIFRLNSLLKPDMGGLFAQLDRDRQQDTVPDLTAEDLIKSRIKAPKGFDLILTNPPFAGEVREGQVLSGYHLSQGRHRIERDILFIERCVELLRPGGRLAIVLPHNKFAVESFAYVRQWVLKKSKVLAVVGLGRNTFLPHTHQKASILFIEKTVASGPSPNDCVFFAVSERDGKNSRGQFEFRPGAPVGAPLWKRVDHDLAEILGRFEGFTRSELGQG